MSDPMLKPGTNFCRCGACGEHFRSVKAFDAHRQGPSDDRRCLPTPRMAAAKLSLDSECYWRLPKREFVR